MPSTVPNNPMKGVTDAVVASQLMLRSILAISSLTPSCRVRSSAARLVTLPRALTWRSISSYPKSKTATSGDGRNCSLATMTASMPLDLRNARRKRALAWRAPRKACHLEKITVQEKIENPKRMTSTTIPAGPLCRTISQPFIWRKRAAGASKVNSSPNLKSITMTCADRDRSPRGKSHTEHRYNWIEVLLELVVENYAVVERLRIRFHAGLNLLTGETGSGKSLVVDALGLLLGGRTSAETIRTGESRARVAGIFDVRDHAPVRRLLEPAGLDIEDGELIIEREILGGGKSRAFVGSRPVSVALLRSEEHTSELQSLRH